MSRRTIFLLAFVFSATAQVQQWSSVVRIEAAIVRANYVRPWDVASQVHTGGSGFVVDGRRILTNYHVIEDAVDIRLSKTGHFKRWTAKVVSTGPDVDLATLEVVEDADGFFADLAPVTWSDELAPLRSRVTVRGYPLGGTGLSVTEGVVSRIEAKNYRLGQTAGMLPGTLLVIQIDAAINPGNSGGPAFDASDRVVGVAFQGIDNAQNIGYLIPASLARTYLDATADGLSRFRLVDVPFRAQKLENRGLRRYLKVPDGTSGAVVVAVSPLSALAPTGDEARTNASALLIDDVITAIDGQAVGDDLSIALRPGERVQVDCLITHKVVGSTTELSILRGGERLTINASLAPLPPLLPRWHGFDCSPEWVVIGGLVFVPLTAPLIDEAIGTKEGATSAYNTYNQVYGRHGFRTERDRDVVVLINVLAGGDVNHGYASYAWSWKELVTLNGEAVHSLAGLYAAWQRAGAHADFLEFGFGADETAWHRKIILDGALVRESEAQLLALHGIPAHASRGVLDQTERVALQAADGASVPAERPGEHEPQRSALARSRV